MSEKNMESAGFEILAMDNVKSKKTSKGGSLMDLFKCVESLANSTESLRDYVSACSDGDQAEYDVYLRGLTKIQDGLLEKAQEHIRELGRIPTVNDEFDLESANTKVAKQ